MPGTSPGGSPEREAGTGGRPRGPSRGRRVRFLLPHTAIALPSVREEEQLFYQRLEALAAPGPGGFAPLFAADGWSDLTGERSQAAPGRAAPGARAPRRLSGPPPPAEDRLLRKRVVRDGQDGPRPRPGQEVSVKVLGVLEDGGLVERDPRLTFVPGHGDVVQVSAGRGAVRAERRPVVRPASPAVPVSTGAGAGCAHHAARGGRLLPRCLSLRLRPPGQVGQAGRGRSGRGPGQAGRGSRRCARREPDVPPEAPLLFEVTLLEVRDDPDPHQLPPAARLRLGAQRRERGNFHFARGDFAAALRSYRLALRALDGPVAGESGQRGGRSCGSPGRGAEAALVPQPRPGRRRKRSCRSSVSSASTTARPPS